MNERGPGRRGWPVWIAAAVLVALLAGFDQGAVILVLALATGVLGLVLLLIRGYRGRGAGMIAAGLVAFLIGGAVLGSSPPSDPPAPSASAEAPTTPPASTPAPVRETPSPAPSTGPSTTAPPTEAPSPRASAEAPAPGELRAVDVLALLEIKGRAPQTGYDRDAFAYREVDLDRNGCDTRNDILNRDLQARTRRPGTGECVVLTAMLTDPQRAVDQLRARCGHLQRCPDRSSGICTRDHDWCLKAQVVTSTTCR